MQHTLGMLDSRYKMYVIDGQVADRISDFTASGSRG